MIKIGDTMRAIIYFASLPSLIIGYLIYRADRKEKEPPKELVKDLIGGVMAAAFTIFVSYLTRIDKWSIFSLGNLWGVFLYTFIGVACVEEGSKWLFAKLLLHKNKNYDYLFDGIVYATFVSLGFATIENIIYIYTTGFWAIIIRSILTVPAHAFFGIFMGYYFSLAKDAKIQGNQRKYIQYTILSFLIPAFLHAMFDFLLLANHIVLLGIFLGFVIGLYIVSIRKVITFSKKERAFRERKFCPRCGNRLEGNFCSNCGLKNGENF